MSDNKNTAPPSTLQSYVDSATGAAQSVLGSLTGNTADKVGQTQNHIMRSYTEMRFLEQQPSLSTDAQGSGALI